ncbi:hypothetical protein AYI69_g4615 [Smittium culicis]|uniref:Uncharacterized protein n=1 Tax=Smittium culicis TaxID=133412 RepID=A0A1R1YCE7_9FUNG|nr:hypothetical protein AYI69_g4615 [Smittium culicis]
MDFNNSEFISSYCCPTWNRISQIVHKALRERVYMMLELPDKKSVLCLTDLIVPLISQSLLPQAKNIVQDPKIQCNYTRKTRNEV